MMTFRNRTFTASNDQAETCPQCGAAATMLRSGNTSVEEFDSPEDKAIWSTVWTRYADYTCANGHAWIVLSDQDGMKFKTLVPVTS